MKTSMKLQVIGTILISFFCAAIGQAQFISQISGHVRAVSDSAAVADFPLRITRVDSLSGFGPRQYFAITDKNGYYFAIVAPGIYAVSTVDSSRYKPVTISNIRVESGQNVRADIFLIAQETDAVIAGHVSLSGAGLPGVEIFIYKVQDLKVQNNGLSLAEGNWNINSAIFKTITDQNGNFSVGVLAGNYFIFIPGTNQYLPFWSSPIFVGKGDTAYVKVELVKTPLFNSISGTVFNHKSYRWVWVTAHSLTSGMVYFGWPKSDGQYTIDVFPGRYIVRCDAFSESAHYTLYYDNVTSPQQATPVEAPEDSIDFRLPPTGQPALFTIQGSVVDEDTQTPIAGAYVSFIERRLSYGDSLTTRLFVKTDQNGRYTFTGHTFFDKVTLIGVAYKDGYSVEFYDNQPTFLTATPIVVEANQTITNVSFSLSRIVPQPGFSVSGTVLDEKGNSPEFGAVVAYSTVGIKYACTDSTGFYKIQGFPQGTQVILQAWGFPGLVPEFYNNKFSAREADVIVINNDTTDIDFVLQKNDFRTALGNLSGSVKLSSNKSLGGATVYLKKSNVSDWYAADYTDDNGQFDLSIETYGQYDVRVTVPGYGDSKAVVEVDEMTGLFVQGLQFKLTTTAVEAAEHGRPIHSNHLYHAYPNPFNPSTVITVEMAQGGNAELVIYNVLGQKVVTLHEGFLRQGTSRFLWQGKNQEGIEVTPGLYFYQLKTNGNTQTRSVIFLK